MNILKKISIRSVIVFIVGVLITLFFAWYSDYLTSYGYHHLFPHVFLGFGLFVTLVSAIISNRIFMQSSSITHYSKELEKLVHVDALTGIPNRLSFLENLRMTLASARRHGENIALLMMDLDDFKNVNDSHGHAYGDLLLVQVAKKIRSLLREYDFLARLGGDEFAIIISDLKQSDDIGLIARKILLAFREPFTIKEIELKVTVSIGISVFPYDGRDYKTLLKNADIAMYSVKQSGRNGYQYFSSDLDAKHRRELQLSDSLRYAIEKQELFLAYQPIIGTDDQKIKSVEVLCRWNNPEFGMVSPDIFIPIAEKNGTIQALEDWVMRVAFKQFLSWGLHKNKSINLSVNISSRQIVRENFSDYIQKLLEETHMPAEHLELEVTETTLMTNIEIARKVLSQLNKIKVCISIDDFGTGYSSLSRIKDLPISSIKIDKSFIQDVDTDENDANIVKSILNLAKNLHLKVIAEGVETKEQLEFLREQKCDNVQGFYYARPINYVEMDEYIKKHS